MSNTEAARLKQMQQAIAEYCLMDDTYFNVFFDGEPECMEEILRILMDDPKLTVKECLPQRTVPSFASREARFDAFVVDGSGRFINVEVQNAADGATPRRADYNSAILTVMSAQKGMRWKELPPKCVIMITAADALGGDEPMYFIDRAAKGKSGKTYAFPDDETVIYVSSDIASRQDGCTRHPDAGLPVQESGRHEESKDQEQGEIPESYGGGARNDVQGYGKSYGSG